MEGVRPLPRAHRPRRRTFTTVADVANESAYTFNAPDYLIDVTQLVKQHPDADLMVSG